MICNKCQSHPTENAHDPISLEKAIELGWVLTDHPQFNKGSGFKVWVCPSCWPKGKKFNDKPAFDSANWNTESNSSTSSYAMEYSK